MKVESVLLVLGLAAIVALLYVMPAGFSHVPAWEYYWYYSVLTLTVGFLVAVPTVLQFFDRRSRRNERAARGRS